MQWDKIFSWLDLILTKCKSGNLSVDTTNFFHSYQVSVLQYTVYRDKKQIEERYKDNIIFKKGVTNDYFGSYYPHNVHCI